MSDFVIRKLESKIIVLSNMLEDSIQLKVADLTTQLKVLETQINDVKANTYYKYAITGECEGTFNDADDADSEDVQMNDALGRLLNLSYGSGSTTTNIFSLYISHACLIQHMTFMSVFGTKEVMNPNVQLMIKIVKHPENNIVLSFPFPSNDHHTGFTSEELAIEIPNNGCMVYVYASSSNLTDVSNRHRLSFEFKTNLF